MPAIHSLQHTCIANIFCIVYIATRVNQVTGRMTYNGGSSHILNRQNVPLVGLYNTFILQYIHIDLDRAIVYSAKYVWNAIM